MPVKKRREDISKTKAQSSIPDAISARNRPARSGLNPTDIFLSGIGFVTGSFIRNLFTGRLRTRNQWLIALMIGVGFILLCPLCETIADSLGIHRLSQTALCSIPLAIVGLVFLLNVVINLIEQEAE